jgi:hypothetical protein
MPQRVVITPHTLRPPVVALVGATPGARMPGKGSDKIISKMAGVGEGPLAGIPVGDGLGARLWRAAEAVAMESLHSPFVTAMAQGTLPRCVVCAGWHGVAGCCQWISAVSWACDCAPGRPVQGLR